MNERIKILRKSLGLTLEKFGNRLGVAKSTISNIENGRFSVTDQMIRSICREFNVDYIWLTTGSGDMYIDTDKSFLEKIDQIMAGENDFHKNLLKLAVNLDIKELESIESLINKFLDVQHSKA